MTLEERFHHAMLDIYSRAGKETGYWANYFLRSVRKKGGLLTAKSILRPSKNNKIDKGLQALIDAGRPDISIEATVLKDEFIALFTEDETLEARRRIASLPEYIQRVQVSPELNHPEVILEPNKYIEGAIKAISVNAYERDSKARDACLKKYGYNCAVCNINFLQAYGAIGKKFIHVHHKKPLAAIRSEYVVNPTTDLIPVCPNCHAMLHTQNPPLGIDELQLIYQKQISTNTK